VLFVTYSYFTLFVLYDLTIGWKNILPNFTNITTKTKIWSFGVLKKINRHKLRQTRTYDKYFNATEVNGLRSESLFSYSIDYYSNLYRYSIPNKKNHFRILFILSHRCTQMLHRHIHLNTRYTYTTCSKSLETV